MKELRVVAVLLMLVSLAPLSMVMAQEFEVPLTVSDGVNSYTLYFGYVTGANLCIAGDTYNTHTEAFLPPPPPGGVFDARLISPRTAQAAVCYDQGSLVDLRAPNFFPSGRDSFRVKSQLGTGTAMTISWPAGLSAYFLPGLTLRYFDGTGNVNVDMLTSTTADVTLAGDPATVNIFSAGLVTPQPIFAVAPTSVAFGGVESGTTKTDSVVVSNPGLGTLNITAVGSNNAVFTVLPAAPQSIPPLGSMTFYITFAPTVNGPQNGTITFTDNATTPPPPHTVSVSGSGTAAPPIFEYGLTVGDGTLDASYILYFGLFPAAHLCVDPTDTINGHGEALLPPPPPGGVFDARLIAPAARPAPCYDQGTPNDYHPWNAEGQLDTFKVKFQLGTGTTMTISWPTNLGVHFDAATLRFFDGTGNVNVNMLTTFSVDVTAAGDPGQATIFTVAKTSAPPCTDPPLFGVIPASRPFGNVGVGTSKMDSVVISNGNGVGCLPLNITAIAAPADYSVTPAAPQAIPGAGSMKFYITFAPTTLGPHNGNVSFTHNAVGSPGLVGVTGTGITLPCFSVAPPSLGFFVQLDSTKVDSVVVTNSDPGTMVITSVVSGNPAFTVSPTSGSIPSGGTMKFYVTAGPISTTQSISTTITFNLSGVLCTTGTLPVSGFFSNVEPQFVTLTPDSMTILNGFFFQRPALRTRAPRLSFPNWSNLMQEVVVQGGFQPLSSESDIAGGMVIGEGFMRTIVTPYGTYYVPKGIRSDTAWVRLTSWIPARGTRPALGSNWGVLQGTLKSRVGFPPTIYTHDNYARGLDSSLNPGDLHRFLLRGQQYQIYPYRSKNKLFAELVALKFNIAANDLGKAGSEDALGLLGNLVIHLSGNPLDGMSVRAAAGLIDQYMTFERTIPTSTWFDDAYACVSAINRAFVGPLDTTYAPGPPPGGFFKIGSFYRGKNLHVNGVAGPSSTGGLLTLGAMRPNVLPPTNDLTECEYGFEDNGLADPEAPIPAMKLYQNYPNPFNPTTNINFNLGQPALVTVKVYNVLGQEIAVVLNNEPMGDGYQSFAFDARGLASGVYFYAVSGQDLVTGEAIPNSIGKMVLMK